MVVNNNAAAVLLVLAALARGREVVVSRGESVEIGGGFRVPEVMAQSGARLVDVGTTNRTRVADYGRAIDRPGADVAVVLKVHPSNFRVTGFTAAAEVGELAAPRPARRRTTSARACSTPPARGWPAGPPAWLAAEPAARQTLAAGAGLVTFSGDKLLGGPQAGIIAGRADLVAACAAHPLARALRPGGLVLAALQDVALAYLRRDGDAIPFWRLATIPVAVLRAAGRGPRRRRRSSTCESLPGAGSLPGVTIPSAGVAVDGDRAAALRPGRAAGHRPGRATAARSATSAPSTPPTTATWPRSLCGVVAAVRVVATAGHVDHGKSSLVLALTGTDPDRFAEEKRRGLTIDLGFACTTLPSGAGISFVDVPGHVRFLKNMLAGVGGGRRLPVRGGRHRGVEAAVRGAPADPRAARRRATAWSR